MDFVCHTVLVQLDIRRQHIMLFYAVQVGIEIVQSVDLCFKTAFLRLIQQMTATRSFLVGIRINDQNISIRILASKSQSFSHKNITTFLRLIHRFARPTIFTVFIGNKQIVFNTDNFRIRILCFKFGGFLFGESRFSRTLMTTD